MATPNAHTTPDRCQQICKTIESFGFTTRHTGNFMPMAFTLQNMDIIA